jgi:hypothetical protein
LDERWSDSDYSEGGTDRIVDELDTEYEGIRIVKDDFTWAWWYTPTVPATGEGEAGGLLGLKFKTSLGKIARSHLKIKQKFKNNNPRHMD